MWPILRLQVGGKESGHGAVENFGLPGNWLALDFSYGDPPVFESQAAFLSRLDLLLPGEVKHLSDLDMMPEVLPKELWPKEQTD